MTTSAPGQAPAFLADVERQAPSADRLIAIQNKVAEARDLNQEIKDLEERLESIKAMLLVLTTNTLPEMFQAVGMDKVGLEASGNTPAYDATLDQVVRASISSKWDKGKQNAAFKTLENMNAATLIKTTVVFEFEREDRALAKELLEKAEAMGYLGEEMPSVHHATLSSWLRGEVKEGRVPPQSTLDAIGGYIGNVVNIKKRKEKR